MQPSTIRQQQRRGEHTAETTISLPATSLRPKRKITKKPMSPRFYRKFEGQHGLGMLADVLTDVQELDEKNDYVVMATKRRKFRDTITDYRRVTRKCTTGQNGRGCIRFEFTSMSKMYENKSMQLFAMSKHPEFDHVSWLSLAEKHKNKLQSHITQHQQK